MADEPKKEQEKDHTHDYHESRTGQKTTPPAPKPQEPKK